MSVVPPFLGAQDRVVRGVSFDGNHAIDDNTLRISIGTSRSSWWARFPVVRVFGLGEKRYFDETEFRRDVLRLALLYRQSGFFEAKIDTVVKRDSANVRVRFRILEGEPVRVTDVIVTGAELIVSQRQLLADLPLQAGDPFNRFLLQASVDTLRSVLQNRGYPYADVFRSYDEDRVRRVATARFVVEPGPRARIGEIAVDGAQKISAGVVRRAAGLHPGDLYRKDALVRSQIELYRTDLFNHVGVALADSTPPAGDSAVRVRIEVGEGKLYGTRAGAGYGVQDCFRGLAGVTARDFLGAGRSLDVTGKVSKIVTDRVCPGLRGETDTNRLKLNYNVTASLRQPAFLNPRTNAALSVSAERRSELNTYIRTAKGVEVSFAQEVAWQTAVTASYGVSIGRTEADPAIFCTLQNVCTQSAALFNQQRRASVVGLSLLYDGSNSPLDPSRGQVLSLQGRYSSPGIGSDTLNQFAKGVFDFSSYHRLGRRGVFAWRVRMGGIVPTELGFQARRADFVAPDERLYGGGPNSVRGYPQNELGPLVRVRTDPNDTTKIRTSPTGGTRLVVMNAELRTVLPLFGNRLGAAVFTDAGQVYDPDQPAAERLLRFTPGVGLRLATPLGPVRVDVAYRPDEQTASPLYELTPTGQLQLAQASYVPASAGTPWGRFKSHVQVSLSVGQAF